MKLMRGGRARGDEVNRTTTIQLEAFRGKKKKEGKGGGIDGRAVKGADWSLRPKSGKKKINFLKMTRLVYAGIFLSV